MSAHSYTCISCRVVFASADLQRAHYKSEWHRYNLKRKLAEMAPVTAEEFRQRLLDKQATAATTAANTAAAAASTTCKTCSKHFGTENAFANHLQSRKHREAEARLSQQLAAEVEKRNAKNREKGLDESMEETAPSVVQKGAAAGSSSKSRSEGKNKGAMDAASKPGSSQDVEMEGEEEEGDWEEIEGDPVAVTDCLFCSHSSRSLETNCKHMTKGHSFFLPNVEFLSDVEGMLAYLGEKVGCGFMCLWCNDRGRSFYSLDAVQRHMRDKGHCKLQYEGDIIYEYAEFYDFRKSYPDHEARAGQEEMEGESDEEEVDDSSLQVHQEGYELVLPSGARVGHRELQRYFKQNIPLARQVVKRNTAVIGRIMHQYKALGWSGDKGEAAQRKIRDLRYVQKFRSRKDLHLSLKANKFQPHLRPQVIF